MFLEQAEQLKQHYMAKVSSEVSEAQQNLLPVVQNIRDLKRKVGCSRTRRSKGSKHGHVSDSAVFQVNLRSPCWLDVIQQAIQYSMDDDLVSRIQNELTCSSKQQPNKFSMADK